jgi:lipopolysaccharide export system permease protein
MELQQRFSFAFVPMVFCLLGVALTLLPRSSRANRSWAFVLCLFWLVFYYVLLSLGKALGEKGLIHPALALWLPNIVVGAIASHLFMRAVKESPLKLQAWLENTLCRSSASWIVIWAFRSCVSFSRASRSSRRFF